MYAASSLLKVPTAKLRAVEALANNLLREQNIQIENSFREIAAAGWNQTKNSFLENMNQQLSDHPLFENRARYDANVNLTRNEFDKYLNDVSKDPYGTFALISMAASFFASFAIFGTTCITHRAIRKARAYEEQKRANRLGLRPLVKKNKKLHEKRDGPSTKPERKTLNDNQCEEEEPIYICGRKPLPKLPADE